ncbi:MAG: hypothetical protein EHM45_02475 [Desulfobacteraceae bacterium]|nr:MAG: hypothetical protein EHM45_02475 [Desulfobacteraceae bacterium]
MASNFRIEARRNRDHLHLKLRGDFDGTSAYELIYKLEKHLKDSPSKVTIHTWGLRKIYAFGLAVFQCNFPITQFHSTDFIFTGPYGEKLAF